MNKGVSIALVGATGVVGTKIIQLLEKRAFPVDQIGRASCRERV